MTLVSGRIVGSSSEELAAHLAAETSKWKRVVETAGSVAAMCGVMAAATAAGLALMVAMEMRRHDRT